MIAGLNASSLARRVSSGLAISADERDRPTSLRVLLNFFTTVPLDTLDSYTFPPNAQRTPVMKTLIAVASALKEHGSGLPKLGLAAAQPTKEQKGGNRRSSPTEGGKSGSPPKEGQGQTTSRKAKPPTPHPRVKGGGGRARSTKVCSYCSRSGHLAAECHRKAAGVGPNDPLPSRTSPGKASRGGPQVFQTSTSPPVQNFTCRWYGKGHKSRNCKSDVRKQSYAFQHAQNHEWLNSHDSDRSLPPTP